MRAKCFSSAGQICPKVAQHWWNFVDCWPNLANVDQSLAMSDNLGRYFAKCSAKLTRLWPKLADVGQIWAVSQLPDQLLPTSNPNRHRPQHQPEIHTSPIPDRPRTNPQSTPSRRKICPGMTPNRSKIDPDSTPNRPKIVAKCRRIAPTSAPRGPHTDPQPAPSRPQSRAESTQVDPKSTRTRT